MTDFNKNFEEHIKDFDGRKKEFEHIRIMFALATKDKIMILETKIKTTPPRVEWNPSPEQMELGHLKSLFRGLMNEDLLSGLEYT